MELVNVIWLFLVVFMLHDLEEIIVVENWLTRHRKQLIRKLPVALEKHFKPLLFMTTAQFAVAVTGIFIILSAAVLLTAATWSKGTYLPFFLVCLHVMFLHVFTHIGQTILLRSYTPGVVTAVALILPYGLYTYTRLLEEGVVTWSLMLSTLPFVLLIVPVLHLVLSLGQKASKPIKL